MALLATSLANRTITVPVTDGRIQPFSVAMLLAMTDVALLAAGRLYACTIAFLVEVVAVSVYSDV